jgi:cytochrome P450
VLDLFGAGTETTSTALLWAILFLVNNPDVQETVHKEIQNIVGSGRQPLIEPEFKLGTTMEPFGIL